MPILSRIIASDSRRILALLLIAVMLSAWLIWEIAPASEFKDNHLNQDTRVFTVANFNSSTRVASIRGRHNVLLDQRYCIVLSDSVYYNPLEEGHRYINSSWILNYSLTAGFLGNATIALKYYVYNPDMTLLGESFMFHCSIQDDSVNKSIEREDGEVLRYHFIPGGEYYIRVAFIVVLSGNSIVNGANHSNPATLQLIELTI
ncbi:MAG: hypothetical protein R6V83_07450 [Candidatus Thorarchaeota archaeon]